MKVAVIGASGKMGAWFCREFQSHGFSVVGLGRNRQRLDALHQETGIPVSTDFARGVDGADYVLVSVPIGAIHEVIGNISGHAKRGAVIFDILSVKAGVLPPLAETSRKAGVQYVSTHPMFGPGAESLAGQNVIITPLTGFKGAGKNLGDFFSQLGARVTEAPAELHDRLMALVLNLPHFLNILFGKVLVDSGVPLEQIKQFAGTTFALQEFLAMNVNKEDPAIYGAIQFENPQFKSTILGMREFLEKYSEVLENENLPAFSNLMEENNLFFSKDPLHPQAYDLFYKVLGLLR